MRSLATRETDVALSAYVQEAIDVCRAAGFDLVLWNLRARARVIHPS
jgi:methylmalonyl-CoA mutase